MVKLFFVIIFYALSAKAGQEIGNGGKFAQCADGQFYSYDYILTVNNPFGETRPQPDFKQRVQQMIKNLQRFNDPLALDLQDYMSLLYQQIPGKKYQWFPQNKVQFMWDPDVDKLLPAQCNVKRQAAYFLTPYKDIPYISYFYDPQLIAQVQSQKFGDIQVSMLWVHEWLWNYFPRKNFLKLAYFNRFLHSGKMDTITAAEYYKIKAEFLK